VLNERTCEMILCFHPNLMKSPRLFRGELARSEPDAAAWELGIESTSQRAPNFRPPESVQNSSPPSQPCLFLLPPHIIIKRAGWQTASQGLVHRHLPAMDLQGNEADHLGAETRMSAFEIIETAAIGREAVVALSGKKSARTTVEEERRD
jgi:hypothetical protein